MFFGGDFLIKAYILTIAGAVLLSAVAAILSSDGKMGKFVKGMTRLLVFAIVVTPLVSLFGMGEFTFFSDKIGTDEGYLRECAAMISEKSGREVETYLLENFSVKAEAEVVRSAEDGFPFRKITVNLLDSGIFGEEEHIDMIGRIQAALEERYNCETEVLWRGTG